MSMQLSWGAMCERHAHDFEGPATDSGKVEMVAVVGALDISLGTIPTSDGRPRTLPLLAAMITARFAACLTLIAI